MKLIPGFSGYACDEEGNIWSGGRKLKPWKSTGGYLRVALHLDGTRCVRYIHHLVLETFVGPRPEGMEACHRDDDKDNCRLDNLRWDTRQGNMQDIVHNDKTNGRQGSLRPASRLREEDIPRIFALQAEGWSQKRIGAEYGVSQPTIWAILHRRAWVHATSK